MSENTGRPGCPSCYGSGHVDKYPGYLTSERMPCPACIASDETLYGTAFIFDGRRIDPTKVTQVRIARSLRL